MEDRVFSGFDDGGIGGADRTDCRAPGREGRAEPTMSSLAEAAEMLGVPASVLFGFVYDFRRGDL